MGTLSAKKIDEALKRARDIGLLEERFEICDCELVVRNLRPDEYENILSSCKDLEEVAYLNQFQLGHVSRAVCELNGINFRDVDYVEVEEDDPKKPGVVRTIKMERHAYLEKHVIKSWSKEALFSAYRKVGDVVTRAEAKAKENITFMTPDETADDRFRRLLGDLKEAEEDLPTEVVTRLLEEHGYANKITLEEARAAMERADRLAQEQAAARQAPPSMEPVQGASTPNPEAMQAQAAPEPLPAAPPPALMPTVAQQAEERMRQRTPLNQQPVVVPAAPLVTPPPQEVGSLSRAREIAALEGVDPSAVPPPVARPAEIAELRSQPKVDPVQANTILDKPPSGGLNPKYRPPQR